MNDRRLHEELFKVSSESMALSWSPTFQMPPMLQFFRPRAVNLNFWGDRLSGLEVTISMQDMDELAWYWMLNGKEGRDE